MQVFDERDRTAKCVLIGQNEELNPYASHEDTGAVCHRPQTTAE